MEGVSLEIERFDKANLTSSSRWLNLHLILRCQRTLGMGVLIYVWFRRKTNFHVCPETQHLNERPNSGGDYAQIKVRVWVVAALNLPGKKRSL